MLGVSVLSVLTGASALASRPLGVQQPAWHVVLSDDGTGNWKDNWFLFGDPSRGIGVTNSTEGMTLRAGDGTNPKSDHAVLWTKATFSGDLRVEYDFTVLDRYSTSIPSNGYCSAVLLYSRPSASAPFASDLADWPVARRNADTSGRALNEAVDGLQFNYAFNGDPRGNRFRLRANPGYVLIGESVEMKLFAPGIEHHVVVEKRGDSMTVSAAGSDGQRFAKTFSAPPLAKQSSGHVGLRNMNRREARYRNIRISSGEF
jgi:hypothetical protein